MMYSIGLLTFVLITYVLSSGKFFQNNNIQKVTLTISVIAFSVIIANRSLNVPDTYAYYFAFNDINPGHNYGFSFTGAYGKYGFEYGFVFLLRILKVICFSEPKIFFFIVSLFICTSWLYGLSKLVEYSDEDRPEKSYKNWILILAIFLSYFGMYYCGIAIRSGVAIGINLIALAKAIEKKIVISIPLVVIAFSIQRLSIIIVLLYILLIVLPKFHMTVLKILWLFMEVLIAVNFSARLFSFSNSVLEYIMLKFPSMDYSRFVARASGVSEAGFATFLDWGIGILVLFTIYNVNRNYKLFNSYFVGFVIILFLATIPGYNRVSDNFTLTNVPLLYKWYYESRINAWAKWLLLLFVIILNCIRTLNRYGWV